MAIPPTNYVSFTCKRYIVGDYLARVSFVTFCLHLSNVWDAPYITPAPIGKPTNISVSGLSWLIGVCIRCPALRSRIAPLSP